MSNFVVGLDLGQAQDYTAIAIAELTHAAEDVAQERTIYQVRHLERFKLGTRYPEIVASVRSLCNRPPLRDVASLVVDATGVGRPVVDLLVDAGLSPVAVSITGGNAVTQDEDGAYRVPKRDLVSAVQVLLQSQRLKIASSLALADLLVKELLAFRVKITADAHDTYGAWRESAHDDMVLAVALACWYGEAHPPVKIWGGHSGGEPVVLGRRPPDWVW